MQVTSDVRKALGEKAKAEREKAQAKEEAERRALLEVSKHSVEMVLLMRRHDAC